MLSTETDNGLRLAESKLGILRYAATGRAVLVNDTEPLKYCDMFAPAAVWTPRCLQEGELYAEEGETVEVEGMTNPYLLDAFSASAIVRVYERLSEQNQQKLLGLTWLKMAKVVFAVING